MWHATCCAPLTRPVTCCRCVCCARVARSCAGRPTRGPTSATPPRAGSRGAPRASCPTRRALRPAAAGCASRCAASSTRMASRR
eukprot:scaffold40680_cov60-Phaeocystis_antarctica.AAC.1